MERLTYKHKNGWVGVKEQEDKTVSPTSVAIHKLCELEDVLEKYKIENLEEYICALKEELNEIQTCLNKEIDSNCDLYDALQKKGTRTCRTQTKGDCAEISSR